MTLQKPSLPDEVPSPCTGLCTLDPARIYCMGCRRTIGEIAEWPTANSVQRRAILARLEIRQADEGKEGPEAG